MEVIVFFIKLGVEWEGIRGIKDDFKGFRFDELEEGSCYKWDGKDYL